MFGYRLITEGRLDSLQRTEALEKERRDILNSRAGEMWDNIECGKKYVLKGVLDRGAQDINTKIVEVIMITCNKEAVFLSIHGFDVQIWLTKDKFLSNLLDEVCK